MYWLNFLVLSCFFSVFHSTIAAPVPVARISDLEARLARRGPTGHYLQKRLTTGQIRDLINDKKTTGVLYAKPQDPKDGTLMIKVSPTPAEADSMSWDHIIPLHFIIQKVLSPAAIHSLETDPKQLAFFKEAINHPENLMAVQKEVDNGKGALFGDEKINQFPIKKLIGVRNLLHMYQPGQAKHQDASRALERVIRAVKQLKAQPPNPANIGPSIWRTWETSLETYIQRLDPEIKRLGGK